VVFSPCISFLSVWETFSNPKALLQGFILTQRQNRSVIGQYGVRRNGNIRFSCAFDAKNGDAKLSADVQLTNAFPDPRLRHLHLKDGVMHPAVVESGSISSNAPNRMTPAKPNMII